MSPPAPIANPSTSRAFPITDPTSDALTTSWSPWPSAKIAMISSGALPNVTFSRPPIPGPERAARASVASLISWAVGTIPSAAAKNTAVSGAFAISSTIATGMKADSA